MNSPRCAAFAASVALVLEEIQTVHALRRSARGAQRLSFAIDTCLVAHGVRSGYLVDVCPPNPTQTFTTLLRALRNKSSTFKDVMCWHHSPTMQSFLVHVPLLQAKLAAVLGDGAGEYVFVKLDDSLSVSSEPPDRLRMLLHEASTSMTESPDMLLHALSDASAEETLIPLAAVVIDYPVVYFPAFSGQTSFLGGQPLDVYTVSFKGIMLSDSAPSVREEHVLLKFSCPRILVHGRLELSPGTVVEQLRVKFTARFERIGARMIVTHHTETLDRVAL